MTRKHKKQIVHLYREGFPEVLKKNMEHIDPKKREEAFFKWVKELNEIDIFVTV